MARFALTLALAACLAACASGEMGPMSCLGVTDARPACHATDGPHVWAMRCTCVYATFHAVVADTSLPPTLLFLAAALPEKFNNTGAPPFLQGEATWLRRMRSASPGTEPALCLSKRQRCATCHLHAACVPAAYLAEPSPASRTHLQALPAWPT